jgi:pyrroline-5-carboxylate reductase
MVPGFSIGIIGGSGWLGRAIADSVLAAGLVPPSSLTLSCRSVERVSEELAGVQWTAGNQAVADASELIVLCVRPDQFRDVVIDARDRTLISVMAGVPVRVLSERTGAERVVRAMPNAAARIRRSYTPWYASGSVPPAAKAQVQALFGCCGLAEEVPSEDQFDYLTGLTGSGPAFPALLADAMIRDAVDRGLARDMARRAVIGVVAGASQLLGDAEPADLVRTFIDYGGTTAAALEAMLDGGFRKLVHEGLRAAEARAGDMALDLQDRSLSTDSIQPTVRGTVGTGL